MPKKRTANKEISVPKKTKSRRKDLEDVLLQNIVDLQKVNTDLAEKFDKLAKEISSLLSLFEITAKTFAKHSPLGEYEKDKEFLDKIDKLLDQNKIFAKGLTLMEERLRERVYGAPTQAPAVQPAMPETEGYETSLSTKRPLPKF